MYGRSLSEAEPTTRCTPGNRRKTRGKVASEPRCPRRLDIEPSAHSERPRIRLLERHGTEDKARYRALSTPLRRGRQNHVLGWIQARADRFAFAFDAAASARLRRLRLLMVFASFSAADRLTIHTRAPIRSPSSSPFRTFLRMVGSQQPAISAASATVTRSSSFIVVMVFRLTRSANVVFTDRARVDWRRLQ